MDCILRLYLGLKPNQTKFIITHWLAQMYFKVVQVAEVCLSVSSSFLALCRATQELNNYLAVNLFSFIST